jgi:hypothetical protein
VRDAARLSAAVQINWAAVATVLAPLITLALGAWWERRGTRLISYFSHVAGIAGALPGGVQIQVNTHTVVLRNAGRRSVTNVRLTHANLNPFPLYSIWPPVVHREEVLPNGSRDIVIPVLIPGEQITIHYLYGPPITVDQIHQGVKCDQGFAHQIPVLLQRQYPRLALILGRIVFLIGVATISYWLFQAGRCVLAICTIGP